MVFKGVLVGACVFIRCVCVRKEGVLFFYLVSIVKIQA